MKFLQTAFTAIELITMANLEHRPAVYGLPNILGSMTVGAQQRALSETKESLVNMGVAQMDIDGGYLLLPDYRDIIAFISDCEQCLTAYFPAKDERKTDHVFWRRGNDYMVAEIVGERYILNRSSANEVEALLACDYPAANIESFGKIQTVPAVVLERAMWEQANDDYSQAVCTLRQNGLDEPMAYALLSAAQEAGRVWAFSHTRIHGGDEDTKQTIILQSGIYLLRLDKTVINLRTSFMLVPLSGAEASNTIESQISAFLE